MAASPKITLSGSRDIPFNKLVLSQANVRRVKTGVSIDELAEDIARRTLLQSLSVRPVTDAEGRETGMFEVPAGGRRFRALELLVKQKRMAKSQPVPCVVRTEGLAEEDSLAENSQREALHPLDQFRAFQALREKGLGEEDIAARFFVTPAVVKQRLKLAAVSPKLLDLYVAEEITLDQLMAFTVSSDHAHQEQVWEGLSRSHNQEPYYIKRLLTQSAIAATDRRAQFVGVEAYEAAGGIVMRDLFQSDRGGWLRDAGLLDRLVAEKLKVEAEALRSEGWKWVEAAADFPYGHASGLRRLSGEAAEMTEHDQASRNALQAEFEQLEAEHAQADELPEEIDTRLGELEALLAAFDRRPVRYDPAEIARAGVFVSLGPDGDLHIERGFVRPEDEASAELQGDAEEDGTASRPASSVGDDQPGQCGASTANGCRDGADGAAEAAEEEEGVRPLSDRLVSELTAHRTLALREALSNDPDTAFLAVLHVFCLAIFYHSPSESCLEIGLKSAGFAAQPPGLNETVSAKVIALRHENWASLLPLKTSELWDTLASFDADSRSSLLAYCASLSVNAVQEFWNRSPARQIQANRLAQAVSLDMAAAGWRPTVENYLGRVPKARILEAVREAKGEACVQLIDHLKKPDMAREAERLLADTGWLPEPLRTPEAEVPHATSTDVAADLPAFLDGEPEGEAIEGEDAAGPQSQRLEAAE